MSTSTASSTLWASASKEWIIQPKPKPGRKPKKEQSTSKDVEGEPKGRRFQNRAAQRAFRERKQSQLSELQARIQSYEQGEVERNVALQSIAKHLKEENQKLRQENYALQLKIAQLGIHSQQVVSGKGNETFRISERKRLRDESPANDLSSLPPRKKESLTRDNLPSLEVLASPSLPSLTSLISTPESNEDTTCHFPSIPHNIPSELNPAVLNDFENNSSDIKIGQTDSGFRAFTDFRCGFCNEGTICVCHEMEVENIGDNEFKTTDFNEKLIVEPNLAENNKKSSILDNLPAYHPPLPIRRREVTSPSRNSIFPVSAPLSALLDSKCSGDPSNCLACRGDDFGKAFCAAIGSSAANNSICETCPCRIQSFSSCVGNDSCCVNCDPSNTPSKSVFMPTNDAWQKLKAHPNVEFADLSLLAEVVSRRAKCLGPRIVISPPPQVEKDGLEEVYETDIGKKVPEGSSSRQLVPLQVLLACGRNSFREVPSAGVQEALRMLDAKFT